MGKPPVPVCRDRTWRPRDREMGLDGIHRLQEPLSVTAAFFISARRLGSLSYPDRVGADPFVPLGGVFVVMDKVQAVPALANGGWVPFLIAVPPHLDLLPRRERRGL